jgi:hypothetical protein
MRTAGAPDARVPQPQGDIVAMVDRLAARMKEHPEDPNGWKPLARAYLNLGRYDEAVSAFTEASHRSTGEDASLLADWADAPRDEKPVASKARRRRSSSARSRPNRPTRKRWRCRRPQRSIARISTRRSRSGASSKRNFPRGAPRPKRSA